MLQELRLTLIRLLKLPQMIGNALLLLDMLKSFIHGVVDGLMRKVWDVYNKYICMCVCVHICTHI